MGLIDGAQRLAALQRTLEDPAFAAEVRRWETLTEQWVHELPHEAIDDDVWRRIDTATLPRALPPVIRETTVDPARAWRWRAFAAMAATLVLAVTLGLTLIARDASNPDSFGDRHPASSPTAASHIAQITDKAGTPLLSAVYRPGDGVLELRVVVPVVEGQAPELWVLDKAGKPHSLGLFSTRDRVAMPLPQSLQLLLTDGATVAITLEPMDGKLHDEPSGTIIGSTKFAAI